jgi:hypothetical protein
VGSDGFLFGPWCLRVPRASRARRGPTEGRCLRSPLGGFGLPAVRVAVSLQNAPEDSVGLAGRGLDPQSVDLRRGPLDRRARWCRKAYRVQGGARKSAIYTLQLTLCNPDSTLGVLAAGAEAREHIYEHEVGNHRCGLLANRAQTADGA